MNIELSRRSVELLRDLADAALAGRGSGNKYRDDSIRQAREALEDGLRSDNRE